MSNITVNPWNFPNVFEAPFTNNPCRITYYDLGEIAMGAPLGGRCFFDKNTEKVLIYDWCGGPPVWELNEELIAMPIWTRKLQKGTVQQIGIVDTNAMTLSIFSKIFRVLELSSFNTKTIYGYDSPIYKRADVIFDIEREKIEAEIKLSKIAI